MKKYEIIYANGMKQNKNLIAHSIHTDIINPLLSEAHQLEIDKLEKASKAIKAHVKKTYGDYFTDQSPLFDAIESGVLDLPNSQGGKQNVQVYPFINYGF